MKVLATNLSPVVTQMDAYPESWHADFKIANSLALATGYVSVESVSRVLQLIKLRDDFNLTILVGMALSDGLTKGQLSVLEQLHDELTSRKIGEVRIVTNFAFHGKASIFSFQDKSPVAYVGSSNLSGVIPLGQIDGRNYEIDVRIEDQSSVSAISDVLERLLRDSSERLDLISSQIRVVKGTNTAIHGLPSTRFVTSDEYLGLLHNHPVGETIEINISTSPGSSLNDYFGARENKTTGKSTQRDWYEVSLIVPKADRTSSLYFPVLSEFFIVTDDGYEFVGKTSGTDGKNFSSRGNNRIFGRWIKGKLEDAGVLERGERVTDKTLQDYGSTKLLLQKTDVVKFDEKTQMQLPVFVLSF
jgi:hypothetical protein